MLAAASLDDAELTNDLAASWVNRGLVGPRRAATVREAAEFKALHEVANQALWAVLGDAADEAEALLDVSEAAWRLKNCAAVLAIAERLLSGPPRPERLDQLARRCCGSGRTRPVRSGN